MGLGDGFYRIKRLPPYVFAQVQALKLEARQRGEDIIDFGMGNPDQPTPPHIVEAEDVVGVAVGEHHHLQAVGFRQRGGRHGKGRPRLTSRDVDQVRDHRARGRSGAARSGCGVAEIRGPRTLPRADRAPFTGAPRRAARPASLLRRIAMGQLLAIGRRPRPRAPALIRAGI